MTNIQIDNDEMFMTIADVKAYTTLSYNQIKKAVRNETLKSVFIGSRHLFRKQWVDTWLGGNDE